MAIAASVHPSAHQQLVDRVFPKLCELADRQRAAVAAQVPEMAEHQGLVSLEVWFLWGAITQLAGDDAEQATDVLAYYIHHRRGMPAQRALGFARGVAGDVTEQNPLVDGMVLAGREAVRIGSDCGFVAGALFIQQATAK